MIDVTNKYAVGVRNNEVVILKFGRVLTRDEAMNLAAWLVASAEVIQDSSAEFDAGTDFDMWLQAVRST